MTLDVMQRIQQLSGHPEEFFSAVLVIGLVGAVVLILVHAVTVAVRRRPDRQHRRWNLWEQLVYLATVLAVAGLAVTSFVAVLRYGKMEGWWLFAHMGGAGAFVALLPLLAVTWYAANGFDTQAADDRTASRFFWLPKATYWLILIGGLVVILTMLLSMLPLFGTETLELLLTLHRYAGLLVVVAATLHLYGVVLQRLRLR